MKKFLFVSVAFLLVMNHPLIADDIVPVTIQVFQETEQGFKLRIHFKIDSLENATYLNKLIERSILVSDNSFLLQPLLVRTFAPFSENIRVKILQADFEVFELNNVTIPYEIFAEDVYRENPQNNRSKTYQEFTLSSLPQKNELVQRKRGGNYQGIPLDHLQFFPIQPEPNSNRFRFYYFMEVSIEYDFTSKLYNKRSGAFDCLLKSTNDLILNQFSFENYSKQFSKSFKKLSINMDMPISACNIVVSKDGWYKVSYSELKESGVPVDEIDPKTLQLFNKGKEIILYLTGDADERFDLEDTIEFWGEQNRNTDFLHAEDLYYDAYSIYNVYVLYWNNGKGLRYGVQASGFEDVSQTVRTAKYFINRIHIEEDNAYHRLGGSEVGSERDHWFFDNGIGNGELRDYTLSLPKPYPFALEPIKMRLMFHSSTPGHHSVEVYFNNKFVGDGEWGGVDTYLLEGQIEDYANIFSQSDELKLSIANRSRELDIFLLNWLEIDLPQSFEAGSGPLVFSSPGNLNANIFRFRLKKLPVTKIDIFKIGAYKILNYSLIEVLDSLNQISYEIEFKDQSFSALDQYVALADSQKLLPDTLIFYDLTRDLTSNSNQADYLVITHDEFLGSSKLQNFIQYKSQSFNVNAVSLADIYQQFNHGISGPIGIKRFIEYARLNWSQPSPAYILLVGDGSVQANRNAVLSNKEVPVYSFQTYRFGTAASDTWYISDLDGIPNLGTSIGRWPVQTEEQLGTLVDKTLVYEQENSESLWRNRLLMIVGGQDTETKQTRDIFFQQTEDLLRDYVNPGLFQDKLRTAPSVDSFYGTTEDLLNIWNSGTAYINYIGHGGGRVWADDRLLVFEDVEQLTNPSQFPFITSMTCFTNSFDASPSKLALGEALLLHENGGTAAILGASGVGWVLNDYYLLSELMDVMFRNLDKSIGSIIGSGKLNYFRKYNTPQITSLIHQNNLLGDPSLKLKFPQRQVILRTEAKPLSPGDIVSITAILEFSSGKLHYELRTDEGIKINEESLSVSQTNFNFYVKLPSDEASGKYSVKVFAASSDGSWIGNGTLPLEVSGKSIHKVWTNPAQPIAANPTQLFVQGLGFAPTESIQVFFVFQKTNIDSFEMTLVDQDKVIYEGELKKNFAEPGARIPYYISIYGAGNIFKSEWQTLKFVHPPSFSINPRNIKLQTQDKNLLLYASIKNKSNYIADSLLVQFWAKSVEDLDYNFIDSDTVQIIEYEETFATVDWILPLGKYNIKIQINGDSRYPDIDTSDNLLEHKFTAYQTKIGPDLISTGYFSQKIDSLVLIKFDLHQELDGKIFSVNASEFIQTPQQDLEVLKPQNWTKPSYTLSFVDEEIDQSLQAQFKFVLQNFSLQVGGTNSMYKFYPSAGIWALVSSQNLENDTLSVQATLGKFSFMQSMDSSPPVISIQPNNRGFYEGGHVGKDVVFTLRLEDANGAHPEMELLEILLNGIRLKLEDNIKGNFHNGNFFAQLFLQELSGQNQLTVKGKDTSSNISSEVEVSFQVSDFIDLKPLGNYPNPFINETVFAFELTSEVEDLTLKIYTNSGKLVRTFQQGNILEDPNIADVGYHEITWDGSDEEGIQVANGVYYYRYTARFNKETIKKIGKLARIQ